MPHGAEWHDGGSAGFTQFPERFRTSIRHSLGFGIVAEGVKPDPAKSQLETCRNQVVGTNRIGMIRPAGHRTRKEPSLLPHGGTVAGFCRAGAFSRQTWTRTIKPFDQRINATFGFLRSLDGTTLHAGKHPTVPEVPVGAEIESSAIHNSLAKDFFSTCPQIKADEPYTAQQQNH
jgi:hypothetical protein